MVFPSRQPASGAVDLSTVVLRNGSQAFTAAQSMGGFKLTDLGAPSAAGDAATKAYVDGVAGGGVAQGSNGTVFATAAGATTWVGPGSTAQPLLSAGTGAPYFGSTVVALTQRIRNDLNTTVSVGARVLHELETTVGSVGLGVRLEFSVTNIAADNAPIAAIDAVALDVSADAEVGVLDFVLANGLGAVDTRALRVAATALSTYTGSAWVPLFSRTLGEWLYGSDDAANGGSAVLLAPSSGAGLYLRRGSTNHLAINSAGALTLGSASFQTTLTGSRIVLQTPIAAHDANTSSVVTAATIAHTLSSGSAAAGIGARATLAAHNAAGTLTDACAIDGILTNTGAGTEAGALAVSTRTGGGALTERLRVHGAGGVTVGSTQSLNSGIGLANNVYVWGRNAADGAWAQILGINASNVVALGSSSFGTFVEGSSVTLQHSSSSSVQFATAGGVRFTYLGFVFGSSGVERVCRIHPAISQSGTAGYTGLEIDLGTPTSGSGEKRSLSVVRASSEQFGLDENGCFVGLRLRRTAVTDTAHTVAALSAYVDMVGLTAARTVTGPNSVVAGTVVVITNGDGSATGANTVTFAPASGTVNGSATHVAINAAYGSCTYVCDGTNWTIQAKI